MDGVVCIFNQTLQPGMGMSAEDFGIMEEENKINETSIRPMIFFTQIKKNDFKKQNHCSENSKIEPYLVTICILEPEVPVDTITGSFIGKNLVCVPFTNAIV
jgi:hypothetical protein